MSTARFIRGGAIEAIADDFDPAEGDYGVGRRCACGTWISRYNPHRRCYVCESKGGFRRRVPADVPLSRFFKGTGRRKRRRIRRRRIPA